MKSVKIICGMSGSGKSTLATELAKNRTVICSADDYFVSNGKYSFDPSKLGEAHASCLRNFTESCQSGEEMVIVDNTNTTVAEVAPYAALALAYGYDLEIFIIKAPDDTGVFMKIASRNVHGVPNHVIELQAKRLSLLTDHLPPWWKVTHIDAKV